MAKKIRGNADGINGENETYTIHGRGIVERAKLVEEVKKGQHPNHSIYKRDGEEYVRSKPNSIEVDNVDKD